MNRVKVEVNGQWVPVDGARSAELYQAEPGPTPAIT
ncbi:hypothetical protein YW5DRAFT_07144 [Streptomyces sp. Ncost-T6T-1]|nr:hypothetical protein YW5DRAFT_07144 [Streptomyces sp. Ncost-T6T-1]